MQYLDRLGWPVERVKGRPVLNLFRLLIHTRRIVRHWEPPKPKASIAAKQRSSGDNSDD